MRTLPTLLAGASVGALAVALPLWAVSPTGPLTTFNTGEVASASEVNANFAALRDKVDELAAAGTGIPDFDSGWVAADAISTNQKVFNHALGVVPRQIQIMLADHPTSPTVVRYVDNNTQGLSGFSSPETVAVNANWVMVGFFSGDFFIYCDVNNKTLDASGNVIPCTTIDSGFVRVMLWK